MRRTKENHHNKKFIRFITYPIRVFVRAKNFYVRSLSDYANSGVGHSGGMGLPGGSFTSLPKSFSVNSSRRSEESDRDYAELVRVASLKRSSTSSTGLSKSRSVAMGRIDEDGSCDFGQVGGVSANNYKKDLLYPRSRSASAVTKRNLVF